MLLDVGIDVSFIAWKAWALVLILPIIRNMSVNARFKWLNIIYFLFIKVLKRLHSRISNVSILYILKFLLLPIFEVLIQTVLFSIFYLLTNRSYFWIHLLLSIFLRAHIYIILVIMLIVHRIRVKVFDATLNFLISLVLVIFLLFWLLGLDVALLAGEAGLIEEEAVGSIYSIHLLLHPNHKTLVILLKLKYFQIYLILFVTFVIE